MDIRKLRVSRARFYGIVATTVLAGMVGANLAYADFATQLMPFFFTDGTQLVSVNGEPADAVLNRFFDTPKERIIVQLMTQYLNPGQQYDVWLEGSNDGIDHFSWWVRRAKATAQGKLNVSGVVDVGNPPGPAAGSFENPRAAANVVIKTLDGDTVQTAYFPEF